MPNIALSEDSLEHLCSGKSWPLVWREDGSWSSFDPFPDRLSNKCYQPKSNGNNLTKRSVAHFDNSYHETFFYATEITISFDFFPPQSRFFILLKIQCWLLNDSSLLQCSLNLRKVLVWIKSIWWSRNFCLFYLRPATSLL